MNAQFQCDIKLLHKINKDINSGISKGNLSIELTEIRDKISEFIWKRRWLLLEQLRQEKFNDKNYKK